MSLCDLLCEYSDGELDASRHSAFEAHLAECKLCSEALHEILQLDAMVMETVARPRSVSEATPIASLAVARKKRLSARWIAPPVAALAAAAAAFLVIGRDGEAPLSWSLGRERTEAARFAVGPAATHRPLAVTRAAGAAAEAIDVSVLVALQRAGDQHGLAVAQFLSGNSVAATLALGKLPESAAVLSDRAAIALASGQTRDALRSLERALELDATFTPARWNRALLWSELGAPLAAAREFTALAATGEPGWSAEAAERAGQLERATMALKVDWLEAIQAGEALVAGQAGLEPSLVRAQPGLARLYFYDALRKGTVTPARLAGAARLLDSVFATDVLTRWAGTSDLAALRRLDTLLRSGWDGRHVPAADLDEFRRIAGQMTDPWFVLLAAEQTGFVYREAARHAEAEVILLEAARRCEKERIDYRCNRIDLELGDLYLQLHRGADALRVIERGRARAERAGDWVAIWRFLAQRAELALVVDDVSPRALTDARPYLSEFELRDPGCPTLVFARELEASLLINRLRYREAAARLADTAACNEEPPTMSGLLTRAQVLEQTGSASEIEQFQKLVERFRHQATEPTERVVADHVEGRVLLRHDLPRAVALLDQVLAAVPPGASDMFAIKVREYSVAALAVAAARQGRTAEVFDRLAHSIGIAAPDRCALAIAVDSDIVVVARDRRGQELHRLYQRVNPLLDVSSLVPAEWHAELAACEVVDVLARAPVQGDPHLLPRHIAWRYRVAPTKTASLSSHDLLVVSHSVPPAELLLARLPAEIAVPPTATHLTGPRATPRRTLDAMRDASWIELHVHGLVGLAHADAAFLALSPDDNGEFALTAGQVAAATLPRQPVVILGACYAASATATFHDAWGLPLAFRRAGARAVVASPQPLPDEAATRLFAELRRRVDSGAALANALRDLRVAGAAGWIDNLVLFE